MMAIEIGDASQHAAWPATGDGDTDDQRAALRWRRSSASARRVGLSMPKPQPEAPAWHGGGSKAKAGEQTGE